MNAFTPHRVRRRRVGRLVIGSALVALAAASALVACDVQVTRSAIADAFVDATTPSVAYGTTSQIVVDASPLREVYLQFDLSEQADTVIDARLRLHVADLANAGSVNGGTVAAVSGPWDEATVTYDTRPTSWGPAAGEIGAVTANTWVEVAVPSAVVVGGVLTLGIQTTSTDGAYYDSHESGDLAPQLIVTTGKPRAALDGTTIAAVGDMACAPGSTTTATACRQVQVSDAILADPSATLLQTLGDLQYENGALSSFQTSYEASYGRLKPITKPLPGNHEYNTPGATGYYSYFGAAAGDPSTGYYSYDIGSTWHVVVLNSNCGFVSCAAGSVQEQWLRADLAASDRPCTIAAWHHPRFTSAASHSDEVATAPFWDALQADGADLVLNGHTHQYERFEPQLPDGTPSPLGIREIIVGTGGRSVHEFAAAHPNSVARLKVFGYLRLVLGTSKYSWELVDETGAVRDRGTADCHS